MFIIIIINHSSSLWVDNTASILTLRPVYSRREQYLVPVVISDGDSPPRSSTTTLTVRVCSCDRHGATRRCEEATLALAAGLSMGALIAILMCVAILLSTEMLLHHNPSPKPW